MLMNIHPLIFFFWLSFTLVPRRVGSNSVIAILRSPRLCQVGQDEERKIYIYIYIYIRRHTDSDQPHDCLILPDIWLFSPSPIGSCSVRCPHCCCSSTAVLVDLYRCFMQSSRSSLLICVSAPLSDMIELLAKKNIAAGQMDDILHRLVDAASVDDRALHECVSELCSRSADAARRISRARLILLQEPEPQRERELLNWIRIGQHAEEQLGHFLQYLESKAEHLAPGAGTAASGLTDETIRRHVTVVQRHKSEVAGAMLKASLTLEQQRRRADESAGGGGAGDKQRHAAVQSLLRTRAVLSIEVQRVEGALEEIKSDTENMETLHQSLLGVTSSMGQAKSYTRRLLAADTVDSAVLRISFVCFMMAMGYVLLHRLFGLFPVEPLGQGRCFQYYRGVFVPYILHALMDILSLSLFLFDGLASPLFAPLQALFGRLDRSTVSRITLLSCAQARHPSHGLFPHVGLSREDEGRGGAGPPRGADTDFKFKFSHTYTVSNPESQKMRMESRNRPEDLLGHILSHTRPTSLLPYREVAGAEAVGQTFELTDNFMDTLKEQEAQRKRRVRTHKIAEHFLHQTMERRPEVQPVFVGSTENPGQMKQVRLSAYKPTRETLLPPKLNVNTGAALVGTETDSLGIPLQSTKDISPDDRILFDWWNNRQAVRERRRDEEQLSKFVTRPLSDVIRQLITKEEAKALQQNQGQGHLGATKVSIAPSARTASLLQDTTSVEKNVAGTSRGMVLPLSVMQHIFRETRALMHETVIGLLTTYRHGRRTARELGEDEADEQNNLVLSDAADNESVDTATAHERKRVSRVVDMEELSLQLLLDSEHQLAAQAKDDSLLPSCVSLPPERIFTPCLVLETATSVALLWKILEQVRAVVPGMNFAIHIFEHYILPHVYDTFSSYSSTIPSLGGLSEQIMQLSTIPLRMEANRLASIAYEQSKADSKYIEYAMKHWALRGWRRNIHELRQREKYLKNVLHFITRIRMRRLIHAVFAAWRFEARNLSNMNYLKNVRQEYVNFLNGTDFPAEASGAVKSRLLATHLAETALHVKGAKKEQANFIGRPGRENSIMGSGGPTSMLHRSSLLDSGRAPLPSGPQTTLAKVIPSIRSMSLSMASTRDASSVYPSPRSNATHSSSISPRNRDEGVQQLSVVETPYSSNIPWEFATATAHPPLPPAVPVAGTGTGTGTGDVILADHVLPARVHDLQVKASGTFEDMLCKLREMEDVCNHLRAEIGVQTKMLRKVEQERDNLRERNRTLEEQLLRVTEEKVHYCNVVQEKQFVLNDRDRRITQLKSRIRAHRNRPWQRVVLRVVGELCGSSTHISEALDNLRIRKDQRPDRKAIGFAAAAAAARSPSIETDGSDDGRPYEPSQQDEEERLFGKLAPIVLSSSYPLPDALLILQDWANACLDDLQDLDDLKGGALSTRFSTFSEEARNAILLSRLLFYLSLPRYLQRTASRDQEKGADGEEVFGTNYPDRRRQLLRQCNVQLDAPFPVYPECFGDLLSMRPSERMTLLLQFATELMAGSDMLTNPSLEQQRQQLYKAVFNATDLQNPPAAGRIELQEVIDPHALAMGERASVVTFVSLLYCRFAHPFNHKCKQSAEVEKAAILHLLSGGVQYRQNSSRSEPRRPTIEEEIMLNLEDEDKSPWYLFKERCLPVFGTSAHPFLLRGNFWPSDAFDSPQLANILGELGMALNRSLQLHRWHVIICCLVPVMTYSGLSRGVFTGARASPQALRVGLEREGEWNVPLHCRCFLRVYAKRASTLRAMVRSGKLTMEEVLAENPHNVVAQQVNSPPVDSAMFSTSEADDKNLIDLEASPGAAGSGSPLGSPQLVHTPFVLHTSVAITREAQELLHAIHLTSSDLLTLFLRRSTLSAELALPTLSLGGWRLLCTDLKLLASVPEEEENAVLDMDVASTIFYEAVMALNEVATSNPAEPPGRARANTFTGSALPQGERRTSLGQQVISSWTAIPKVSDDMTFAAFLIAMSLVANEMFPLDKEPRVVEPAINFQEEYVAFQEGSSPAESPVPSPFRGVDTEISDAGMSSIPSVPDSPLDVGTSEPVPEPSNSVLMQPEKKLIWLGNCLQHFIHSYIPKVAGDVLSDDPRAVIHRLTMGAGTQEVLARYTPAIILVFNSYSKDVYGAAGMEKEDVLQLLRDAMLTSTEISPHLIYEVFQHCCVTRHSYEEEAAAKRREIDGKPRDGRRRAPRAVSILDPRTKAMTQGTHQKDIQVLVYEGFMQFLCVMCSFKIPNPLIPYCQRLDVFLRRSVLRPLQRKVENLAPLLSQTKTSLKRTSEEVSEKDSRGDARRDSMRRESLGTRRRSLPNRIGSKRSHISSVVKLGTNSSLSSAHLWHASVVPSVLLRVNPKSPLLACVLYSQLGLPSLSYAAVPRPTRYHTTSSCVFFFCFFFLFAFSRFFLGWLFFACAPPPSSPMHHLLESPEVSYSRLSWLNIASALGCLCVQQRTDAGRVKSSAIYNRYLRSACDQSLFRVLHTTNPIDFVDERQRMRDGRRLDDGSERRVLAVADALGDVMEAFSIILHAWEDLFAAPQAAAVPTCPEAERAQSNAFDPPVLDARRKAPQHFTVARWAAVLSYLRGEQPAAAASVRGRALGRRVETNASAPSRALTPAPSPAGRSHLRSQSSPAGDPLSPLGPPKSPRRFPVAALQAIREGHLSALDLATEPTKLGPTDNGPRDGASPPPHPPSPPPAEPARAEASGSDAPIHDPAPAQPSLELGQGPPPEPAAASEEPLKTHRRLPLRLPSLQRPEVSWHGLRQRLQWRHIRAALDIRTSQPVDKAVASIAAAALVASAAVLLLATPPLVQIPAVAVAALSALVLLFYLKPAAERHPLRVARALRYNRGARVRRLRKAYTPLSKHDQHLLTQLQNYGAPYSCIVLRPLRGWNQRRGSAGWAKTWSFAGLHFTERQSPYASDVLEVRAAINISNASIGTMQSVLLEPFYPEVAAAKDAPPTLAPSFMYPLCTDMEVVQQLENNVFILRTVFHSRVLGVTPYETFSYVSPAVLLDEDQQRELGVRHPFQEAHATPTSAGSASDARAPGYAYMWSSVHCPLEALSSAVPPVSPASATQLATLHHLVWIGFDEPDGTLTLCVNRSLAIPSLSHFNVAYRHTVYRSIIHALFRFVKILQYRGPLPNELIAYRNNSRYYPFLSASGDGTGDGPAARRSPQPPPGIHWSADTPVAVSLAPALEPLGGIAGQPSSTIRSESAAFPSGLPTRGTVLPAPLVRFLEHMAQASRERVWETLVDNRQNGVQSFFTPRMDSGGFRQLKTEMFFPFQCLDAVEMALLGTFLFPTFGFEVSRREPLGMVGRPAHPDQVGLVPVETLYKVRGAERVVSPRSVTMELIEGVHFTAGQLLDAIPESVAAALGFLHKLPPDTCMFFYGGETRSHEQLQQMLSPLDRPLCIELPSYGFLCWKSKFATDPGSPVASSPRALAADGGAASRPDSTAGGVRAIAYVKHGSVRPFCWGTAWQYKRKQIQQVEEMVRAMKDVCRQYVCSGAMEDEAEELQGWWWVATPLSNKPEKRKKALRVELLQKSLCPRWWWSSSLSLFHSPWFLFVLLCSLEKLLLLLLYIRLIFLFVCLFFLIIIMYYYHEYVIAEWASSRSALISWSHLKIDSLVNHERLTEELNRNLQFYAVHFRSENRRRVASAIRSRSRLPTTVWESSRCLVGFHQRAFLNDIHGAAPKGPSTCYTPASAQRSPSQRERETIRRAAHCMHATIARCAVAPVRSRRPLHAAGWLLLRCRRPHPLAPAGSHPVCLWRRHSTLPGRGSASTPSPSPSLLQGLLSRLDATDSGSGAQPSAPSSAAAAPYVPLLYREDFGARRSCGPSVDAAGLPAALETVRPSAPATPKCTTVVVEDPLAWLEEDADGDGGGVSEVSAAPASDPVPLQEQLEALRAHYLARPSSADRRPARTGIPTERRLVFNVFTRRVVPSDAASVQSLRYIGFGVCPQRRALQLEDAGALAAFAQALQERRIAWPTAWSSPAFRRLRWLLESAPPPQAVEHAQEFLMAQQAAIKDPSALQAAGPVPVAQESEPTPQERLLSEADLTEEQRQVLDLALQGYHMYVGGSAGTGKSVLLRVLRRRLAAEGIAVAVTATTGLAAFHIGGTTLHHRFGITMDGRFLRRKELTSYDVLIIDEVSMLSQELFEALELQLRIAHRNHLPFGGVQIILCGDFLQLGAIAAKSMVTSALFRQQFVMLKLTRALRQGENPLFHLQLQALRQGKVLSSWTKTVRFIDTVAQTRRVTVGGVPTLAAPTEYQSAPLPEGVVLLPPAPGREDEAEACPAVMVEGAVNLLPTNELVRRANALMLRKLGGEEVCYDGMVTSPHLLERWTPSFLLGPCANAKEAVPSISLETIQQLRVGLIGFVRECLPPPREGADEPVDDDVQQHPERHVVLYRLYEDGLVFRVRLPPYLDEHGEGLFVSALEAGLRSFLQARAPGLHVREVLPVADGLHTEQDEFVLRQYVLRSPMVAPFACKVGAKVMLRANLSRSLVNGSLGTIVGFEEMKTDLLPAHLLRTSPRLQESVQQYADFLRYERGFTTPVMPVVDFGDGKPIVIPPLSFPVGGFANTHYYASGLVTIPLTLAYAFTVHKVQGLTLVGRVHLELSRMWPCEHLLYVAMSRVKNPDQLSISNFHVDLVRVAADCLLFDHSVPTVAEAKVLPGFLPATWVTDPGRRRRDILRRRQRRQGRRVPPTIAAQARQRRREINSLQHLFLSHTEGADPAGLQLKAAKQQ
eukprot:gene4870-3491_t